MGLMDKVKQAQQPATLSGVAPSVSPAPLADKDPAVALAPRNTVDDRGKQVAPYAAPSGAGSAQEALLRLITTGDLSKLSVQDKIAHYVKVCTDVGLNPMTKPFDYVTISGKTALMANKEASAQLAQLHKVSVEVRSVSFLSDFNLLEVWVRASTPDGRITDELGAVPLTDKVKGADAANARMKCVTKAKRRAVLAHCGLGAIDETEVETVAGAKVVHAEAALATPVPSSSVVADAPAQSIRAAAPVAPAPAAQPSAPQAVVEAEVVTAPAQEIKELQAEKAAAEIAANPDAFRWEDKACRQRLIKEIKARFPGISNDNVKHVADAYRLAGMWSVILRGLDDLLAFEKTKDRSALLVEVKQS